MEIRSVVHFNKSNQIFAKLTSASYIRNEMADSFVRGPLISPRLSVPSSSHLILDLLQYVELEKEAVIASMQLARRMLYHNNFSNSTIFVSVKNCQCK